MKKLILVILFLTINYISYAQTNTFPSSGNVGIGTTSPAMPLDVKGIVRSTTGGLQIGKFGIPSNPILSIGIDRSDFPNAAIINGWGNSSNPGISVGTTRNDGVAFSVVTGATVDANHLPLTTGTTAFTVLGMGNVGIGTTSPNAPLEVVQPTDASVPLRLYGGSTSTVVNKKNMLAFMISDTQGGEKAAAGIEGISNNQDVTGGYLSFLTSNGNIYDPNGLTERMRIDASGNIGIGTTSPLNLLTVVGSNGGASPGSTATFSSSTGGNQINVTNQQNNWGLVFGFDGPGAASTSTYHNPNSGYLINVQNGPLYFGTYNAPNMTIAPGGNVGIGTINPGSYKLAVNGGIHSQSVNVDLTGWSDYVFKKEYQLPSLSEVKTYIDQNHHLPEMPSEQEVVKDGINLGEMNKLLTKKVEELTLYLIDKDIQLKAQQQQINQQQKGNEELNVRVREQQMQIDEQKSANIILQKEIGELKRQFITLSKSPK